MAMPTTPHGGPAQQQAATSGITGTGPQQRPGALTSMGPMPAAAAPEPQKPMLPEGFDKVLLLRVFPDSLNTDDAAAKALAQGEETQKLGAAAVASQQIDPVAEFNAAQARPQREA